VQGIYPGLFNLRKPGLTCNRLLLIIFIIHMEQRLWTEGAVSTKAGHSLTAPGVLRFTGWHIFIVRGQNTLSLKTPQTQKRRYRGKTNR